MANDDRNRPPPARPAGLEPIKIRELRTMGPNVVLPTPFKGLIRAGDRPTGETITIQYEPWQRHHRVREYELGKLKSEVCIPESWVSYVPEWEAP